MNFSPNDTRLVMPSDIYARSYQAAIAEGLSIHPDAPPADMAHLAAHLTWLNSKHAEIRLPNGRRALRVPQVEAWLTHAYTFIGRVIIRTRLTPELEAWGGHIAPEIRPSLRGRGLGTYLFDIALEKARENGLRRMLLTCRADDVAAQRMFLRQGAIEVEPAAAEVRRFIIEG